mgnify:FL=1
MHRRSWGAAGRWSRCLLRGCAPPPADNSQRCAAPTESTHEHTCAPRELWERGRVRARRVQRVCTLRAGESGVRVRHQRCTPQGTPAGDAIASPALFSLGRFPSTLFFCVPFSLSLLLISLSPRLPQAASGDIANYHVILWSSLGLVVVTLYCVMALFNMDISQDSLLYNKSKSD